MTKNEANIKLRSITAFIRIGTANYQSQAKEALRMLVAEREAFAEAGYENQTVRITTQPFPEYTRDMERAEALAFLLEYDRFLIEESKRIGIFIDPNIGPAMMQDEEDTASVELLTELLTHEVQLKSCIIVAGQHGIHWSAVRVAARLVKEVSERSARQPRHIQLRGCGHAEALRALFSWLLSYWCRTSINDWLSSGGNRGASFWRSESRSQEAR